MTAQIDKDEWMDVWNSNTELRAKVKDLESKVSRLENHVAVLEENQERRTIYGKEVKSL